MSGRSRRIKIEVLGDARDAQRAFDALEKSSGGLGDKLKNVASIASGFILAQGLMRLPELLGAATDQAIRLESEARKATVVFGDSLGTVEQWAAGAAAGMGLTEAAAVGLAAGMGDLLVPMGFTREQAAGMSTDVLDLAGALSEWSGGQRSAAEVGDILTKALLGEREELKSLGISINQAEVDAKVLANSQAGVTFETEQQAAAFATQQLIMEKSTDAQTSYAESQDDMASKQARLTARSAEFRETLVRLVTPAIMAGQNALLTLGDVVLGVVEPAIDDLADALGDLWRWIDGRVIPAVEDAVEAFEDFLEPLEDVRELVADFIDSLADGVSFDDLISGFSGIGGAIVSGISASLDNVDWSGVRGKISGGLSVGFAFGVDKAQSIVDAISTAFDEVDWSGVRSKISGGLTVGFTFATEEAQGIVDSISTAFDEVDWSAVQGAVQSGIMGGLASAEAGTTGAGQQIQDWLTSEVEAVEDWTTIGAAVKRGIVGGLSVVSGGFALAVALIDWIAGEIVEGEGDWSTVANNIATQIGTAFAGAVSIAEQIVDWISSTLEDVEWGPAANAVAAGIAAALVSVHSLAQGVADSIAENLGKVDWSGTDWRDASEGMTANLGESMRLALTEAFGEIDLEQVIEDAGLVLTAEALFGEGGLEEALEDFNRELSDIATVLQEELGPTIDSAREAWEKWEPILGPLVGVIADLDLALLAILLAGLIAPLQGAAEALRIFFEATQLVFDGLGLLADAIQRNIDTAGDIVGWSATAVGAITNWAETSITKAGEFLDGVLGPIDEFAIGAAESIAGFVEDALEDLSGWVTDVVAEVEELPGKMTTAIGDLSTLLLQAGRDLVAGLIDGIREKLPDLGGVGGEIKNAVVNGLGDLPGLSPSPLGTRIGGEFIEGLAHGVTGSLPKLDPPLEAVAEAFEDAIAGIQRDFLREGGIAAIFTGERQAELRRDIAALEAYMNALVQAGFGPDSEPYQKALADYNKLMLELEAISAIMGTEAAQAFWDEWQAVNPPPPPDFPDDWDRAFHDFGIDMGRDTGSGFVKEFPTVIDSVLDSMKPVFEDSGREIGGVFGDAFLEEFDQVISSGISDTVEEAGKTSADNLQDAIDAGLISEDGGAEGSVDDGGGSEEPGAPSSPGGGGGPVGVFGGGQTGQFLSYVWGDTTYRIGLDQSGDAIRNWLGIALDRGITEVHVTGSGWVPIENALQAFGGGGNIASVTSTSSGGSLPGGGISDVSQPSTQPIQLTVNLGNSRLFDEFLSSPMPGLSTSVGA